LAPRQIGTKKKKGLATQTVYSYVGVPRLSSEELAWMVLPRFDDVESIYEAVGTAPHTALLRRRLQSDSRNAEQPGCHCSSRAMHAGLRSINYAPRVERSKSATQPKGR
jgi:hypothetical protein